MNDLAGILISCGICVFLPVLIVWLTTKAKTNAINQKYALLQKAIEHGVEIDPKLLIDEKWKNGSVRMKLLSKLQWGLFFLIVGIGIGIFLLSQGVMKDSLLELLLIAIIAFALGVGFITAYIVGNRDEKLKSEDDNK